MTSRLEWEPAIYEHKAALIGASPADISSSADLLSAALVEESCRYGADYLTVGVDVYNLEAEACGAEVTSAGPKACPDIRSPVFSLDELPRELALPEVPGSGRFGVMLEAGRRTVESVAPQVCVRVAASGPVTIATKLAVADYLDDLASFDRVIAGTGVLPFEAVPAAFTGFRRMVEAELEKG